MSTDLTRAGGSPFDAIRRVRPDGTEFWSARDLMPLMGYSAWRNFGVPVVRAVTTAQNQGHDADSHFARSRKVVGRAQGGGSDMEDFELSRFAAYLVAMNGDPNKTEVAAAQAYFAVQTRVAETQAQLPQSREERLALAVIDAQQMIAERDEQLAIAKVENHALAAAIERDAPLVAKAEAHSKSDNAAVNRQVFAREVQAWGVKQGINILHEHVYELLRRKGMLINGIRSDRNHATSQAVKAGWAWTHKDVTPDGHATAVTYLRPSGQNLAWKWVTDHVAEYGDLRPRGGAA